MPERASSAEERTRGVDVLRRGSAAIECRLAGISDEGERRLAAQGLRSGAAAGVGVEAGNAAIGCKDD